MDTPIICGRLVAIVAAVLFVAGRALAADAPAQPSSPELDKARADLRAAWQQTQTAQENVARLEAKLGLDTPRAMAWEFMNNPKRGALGLVFTRGSDSGLRVAAVTPGGAAERAGLRDGDMLLAIDKTSLAGLGGDEARAALHRYTRTLEVGTKVVVQYSRDGRTQQATLVADRPHFFDRPGFDKGFDKGLDKAGADSAMGGGPHPGGAGDPGGPRDLLLPGGHPGPIIAPGELPFQVVALGPELAPYFKTGSGVLVVTIGTATDDPLAKVLKPGDVIQDVDGEAVTRPQQMFSLLLAHAGKSTKLGVVRGGAPLSLDVVVPTVEALEARMRRHHHGGMPFAVE